jgi:hypothetical protein
MVPYTNPSVPKDTNPGELVNLEDAFLAITEELHFDLPEPSPVDRIKSPTYESYFRFAPIRRLTSDSKFFAAWPSSEPKMRRAQDQLRNEFDSGPESKRNRRQLAQPSAASWEYLVWTLSCFIAVLGLVKAGCSEHHLFWLIVWPVPVTIACTIFIFVRQGFHFKDGVLVLGRRKPSAAFEKNGYAEG